MTYDEQIDYCVANRSAIYKMWSDGLGLFAYCGSCRQWPLGCPTLIKKDYLNGGYIPRRKAITDEITKQICEDKLIPGDISEVIFLPENELREILGRFKIYQQAVNEECKRRGYPRCTRVSD